MKRPLCSGCGLWPPRGGVTLPGTKQSLGSATGAGSNVGSARRCSRRVLHVAWHRASDRFSTARTRSLDPEQSSASSVWAPKQSLNACAEVHARTWRLAREVKHVPRRLADQAHAGTNPPERRLRPHRAESATNEPSTCHRRYTYRSVEGSSSHSARGFAPALFSPCLPCWRLARTYARSRRLGRERHRRSCCESS